MGQNTDCVVGEEVEHVRLAGDPVSQGTRKRMPVENLKKSCGRECYLAGILSGAAEVLHSLVPSCSLLAFQCGGMGFFCGCEYISAERDPCAAA